MGAKLERLGAELAKARKKKADHHSESSFHCPHKYPHEKRPMCCRFLGRKSDLLVSLRKVGIYVGNGMMIHCGDPISYASIQTNYWQQHFYCFGRIP